MILIKLGGSAFSNKAKPLSFHEEPVRNLALLIKQHGITPVLIHGGGSFAHPVAKAYGLDKGIRDDAQLIGVSLTSLTLSLLNERITSIFSKLGLPTYTIRTGAVFMRTLSGLKLSGDVVDLVRRLVGMRIIPVFYGDVIHDYELGFSILSGDEIMVELAKRLKPRYALFLMDVEGVYSEGPRRGELIRVFKPSTSISYSSSGVDATGGLMGKLKHAIELAEMSVQTYLCSVMDQESISLILTGGEPRGCTRIEAT
ncbi:isopentenyl phosphate kinase [Caldivirga maquilingensis]|uniref:Isopentenyl phosphate kinase n=1 Tax=Caldivirga maquilingensis (strain ATCC 700844 / DSM 13496 / JCM 10307 / IC-167) TaxID=397948 RepID=A8MDH6_CALMQ|nr:isopentenyl phosphate kinase [Caldivirga maquilingensis]ABW01832.1 aspartate/glutamate/uridylate kinase [Caldivirga maquilingensis IC-167]